MLAALPHRRLSRNAARGEAGSGTAIGVAIMFPVLMLLIMVLHGITSATRAEQSLQVAADRAARTASLCCQHVGPAQDAVEEGVALLAAPGRNTRLNCANDVAGDVSVEFIDVQGRVIPELDSHGAPNHVPAGGYVTVRVACQLSPSPAGVSSLFGSNFTRSAIGTAVVDPYRHRHLRIVP